MFALVTVLTMMQCNRYYVFCFPPRWQDVHDFVFANVFLVVIFFSRAMNAMLYLKMNSSFKTIIRE